jgi:hypothetical protein
MRRRSRRPETDPVSREGAIAEGERGDVPATVTAMTDRPGANGVDPSAVTAAPRRPRSATSVAVGRAMMGLGDIVEGKPPRDAYEHVLESDQSGEPEDPEDLVIEI